MEYRLKSAWRDNDGFHYILTVEKIPGLIGRLFGNKQKDVKYHGSGTVWHEMPTFRRCSTSLECVLSDFYAKISFEERHETSLKILGSLRYQLRGHERKTAPLKRYGED